MHEKKVFILEKETGISYLRGLFKYEPKIYDMLHLKHLFGLEKRKRLHTSLKSDKILSLHSVCCVSVFAWVYISKPLFVWRSFLRLQQAWQQDTSIHPHLFNFEFYFCPFPFCVNKKAFPTIAKQILENQNKHDNERHTKLSLNSFQLYVFSSSLCQNKIICLSRFITSVWCYLYLFLGIYIYI